MFPPLLALPKRCCCWCARAVREAAYGLGVSRWRTTLSITLRTATSGVTPEVMLAFARVGRRNRSFTLYRLRQPVLELEDEPADAALSLQIFTYAISPSTSGTARPGRKLLILIVLIVASVGAVRLVATGYAQGSELTYGRRHTGRQTERLVRQDPGSAGHQHDGGRQSRDAVIGPSAGELHLCALLNRMHETVPGSSRHWPGSHWARWMFTRNLSGADRRRIAWSSREPTRSDDVNL